MNQDIEQPTVTFLFEELEIPELFWWKEFDMILYNFRNTILHLKNTMDRTQGRVCWVNELQSGLMRIQINTANRKTIAREMYDDLRHRIESRCNEVDKDLITDRAKQWLADIEKESDPTPQQMTETVIVQLRRCFEPINGDNLSQHRPYFRDFYDDWRETDLDQYGYSMGGRMTDKECNRLIEAYKVWAQEFQKFHPNIENSNTGIVLPSSLDKCNAKKYFDRAFENGYLELDGSNAMWNETVAQLGYFCKKTYQQPRPINVLEDFFRVKKLAAAITQADTQAKRADVVAWRSKMDSLIFFD